MNLLNTHTPRKTKLPKANNHEFMSKALWKAIMVRSTLKYPLRKKCPYSGYTGPYYPAFGLITERYSLYLRIQIECGKIRTKTTPNMDTFYAVICLKNQNTTKRSIYQHEAINTKLSSDVLQNRCS